MEWGNFDSSIQLRLSIHDKNDKYYKRLELPSKTIVAYFQANNQNFKSNKQPQYTLSTHKTLAHAAMYPYMHMHSQEDIEDILRLKEGIYCPNITQNNNGAIIFNTTDPSNCEEFKKWFEREQAWFEKYKSTPKENN